MYQKMVIVGNLGNDPVMRYQPDGTAVTNFSVAVNRRWTDAATGQPKDETTWFRVSAWGRQGETANQYLSRGSKVLVEGRLRPDPNTGGPRLWNRQDGTVGASFEVTADVVRFMSSRGDNDNGYAPDMAADGGLTEDETDEIPF